MIYVRLAGGLGNQLFQLAAASLLSQSKGVPVTPLLEGLSLYEEPRAPDSIELLKPSGWLRSPASQVPAYWKWFALKARSGRWLPSIGVSDRNFWQSFVAGGGTSRILDGYFQYGWTAETFHRATEHMLVRSISTAAAARIDSDEVVVHIRGGDFLRLPLFQVVDVDFYVRAARQAMELGLNRFAIMSDDLSYANDVCEEIREHLPSADIRLIPRGANALEDFDTLRAATARIIGNSTFAWWAVAFGDLQTPTWSPIMFTRDSLRDFFLPNERKIFR
jgi:hypothetical protein